MKVHTKTALGIDIGRQRLSIALVTKGAQGFRVLAAAGEDLPVPEPPRPTAGKVLSRLLGQLGRRSNLLGAEAAVALSPDSLIIQLLDLPRRVPPNLGEFVRSELQQYVALSGRMVVSDFCGVGSGVQKRLLAVAADGDEIQEAIKACSRTVTGIDRVEPSALAYARAFLAREKGSFGPGHPASVVHPPSVDRDVLIAVLGPRTLTTMVFRRDTLDFVRVRALPGDANTPRLLCVWLAEELKAVARYHDTQVSVPGHDCRVCVAIHDGVHRADDIGPLLAAEAGTKAFAVADVHEPLIASGPAKEESPAEGASMVAVGAALALLGAEGDDLRINLLPKAVLEAKSLVRHVLLMVNAGVILFLGVFATAQVLTRTTHAMDRKIDGTRLAEELYTTPALMAEEKFLDQEIACLRQRVEPLRRVMKGRQETDWPAVLGAVRQATPEGVTVTQLQCQNGRIVSLQGLAPSCPAAEAFVRNLEGQRPFASVSLMRVERRQSQDDRLEYRIDCLLMAKGGKPT